MTEKWYRYEDRVYAVIIDADAELYGVSDPRLELREFTVIKETPAGAWLQEAWGGKRWVKREARKRFACPTKIEALESFIARKERQRAIYAAKARRARIAMGIAERMRNDISPAPLDMV